MISNNQNLSSQNFNIVVTRQKKLKKFILKTNQISSYKQIRKLNDSKANLFNFIKDSFI